MTVNPSTKERVFSLLRARGAVKAVLQYSGGNDEGEVESIQLHVPAGKSPEGADVTAYVDLPVSWRAKEGDKELATLLEQPIDDRYGSWAGDFSAYGTLTWDVTAGTVVMDDYQQSGYDYEQEEW